MKEARVTYEGEEGQDLQQVMHYPAIGKVVKVPLDRLWPDYGFLGYKQGMRTRFSNFLAQDKELSQREKETVAYNKSSRYVEHLLAGGDWKMTGERDTVTEVIDAMIRLWPKKYTKAQLIKAAEYDEDQVANWRADAEVRLELSEARTRKLAAAAKEKKEELVINLPE